jgi:rhodanese-related sulfurtransferase
MAINVFYIDDILNITPKEAFRLCNETGAVLVDVREPEMIEYKQFDVPKVIYARLKEIVANAIEFPDCPMLIFADATGIRSKQAVAHMKERGLDNVANLAGGILEWDRDGLPLNVNNKKQFSEKTMFDIKKQASKK